MILLLQAEEK